MIFLFCLNKNYAVNMTNWEFCSRRAGVCADGSAARRAVGFRARRRRRRALLRRARRPAPRRRRLRVAAARPDARARLSARLSAAGARRLRPPRRRAPPPQRPARLRHVAAGPMPPPRRRTGRSRSYLWFLFRFLEHLSQTKNWFSTRLRRPDRELLTPEWGRDPQLGSRPLSSEPPSPETYPKRLQ